MPELAQIFIFGIVAFLFLLIIAKLLGKKQIAQLDFVDYVIGISLGSIAAEMAVDLDRPFYYYMIAMAIFFVLAVLVDVIGIKGPFLKRLMKGKPTTLIYEGRLIYENLKKEKIDINDLLALSREQGYFDLNQIHYAILETSGNLSIMPVGAERPAVTKDLPIEVESPSLTNYIVIDGRVSGSGLSEINKNEEWLIGKLRLSSKKELKEILLASYDDNTQEITVHYKKPKKSS